LIAKEVENLKKIKLGGILFDADTDTACMHTYDTMCVVENIVRSF
jgi:hypothetical protein